LTFDLKVEFSKASSIDKDEYGVWVPLSTGRGRLRKYVIPMLGGTAMIR
jgi:hypothetical protein